MTGAGVQQTPANGSTENGFVQRFSADGTTLMYATYLTGVGGSTIPAAIVTDVGGDAYIAGSTSASGFPTIAALQPSIVLTPGVYSSGFLTKLNPAGSAFVFSTFVAGAGITGMALDVSTNSLLLSGSVSLGQFPVATVAMPLSSASYQTLLRVPGDGQSVTEGVFLTAGPTSFVSAGANGDAWVSGAVGTPLFSGVTPPDYNAGDSYLLHVTSTGAIDQTLRFGGVPKNGAGYASLTSTVAAPAVSGTTVSLPGRITATVSAAALATQTFELPMVQTPNSLLPNSLRDVIPTVAVCGTSSVCSGSGALLAQVSTAKAVPSLGVSYDDLPNVTVRNLGSTTATGLAITASGYSVVTNCGSSLAPSGLCNVALSGGGPGTLTVSAGNAAAATVALPATALASDALVVSAEEVDFGIVSAASGVVTQTVTVTNLGAQAVTFMSARDGAAAAYTLAEVASTCGSGGATGVHTLAAGASCTITLGLGASSGSANDEPVKNAWKIGPRDVIVTGFLQAAALGVSAAEVDFGTFFAGGVHLPRYLYLSNNSTAPVVHVAAVLPTTSAFAISDGCPLMLQAKSVCQMVIAFQPKSATESDSQTLSLDQGISVLLTGEALPAQGVGGSSVNPSLSVSATQLSFTTAVMVTGVSSTALPLTVTNTGTSGFTLATAIAGDFTSVGNCPSTLGAGSSCTLLVSFVPSQPGARQGLLSVTAGTGFAPQYVALSGTGTAILAVNNGVLSLGQTLVGEPVVAWYKVQQPLPLLTASVSDPAFSVALVADTGTGHGTLPPQAFGATATLACGNCWLGVQYFSQTAQSSSAALTLSTVAGGSLYVLQVTATSLPVQGLVVTPGTQDFGSVGVGGSSGVMTFTLANLLASSAAVSVQSVSVSGDFVVTTNTTGGASCAGQLAATASCFVQVSFNPLAQGDRAGVLTIVTSGGTVSAALSGYGLASAGLFISPSALTFASVPNGAATTQTVTLTNSGGVAVTIGGVTASDASFTVSSGCSALAAGASCSVVVSFVPQSALVAATLSIPAAVMVNGQQVNTTYAVPLTGAYTAQDAGLEILPSEANYGAAATGTVGQTRQFVLNNLLGKALHVTLAMARQFPLAAASPCATLAAGASCTFSVSFVPVETGAQTGTVFVQGVSSDGLSSAQALGYLQGYSSGTGALTITGGTIPYSPLMFGQLTSGQSAQQPLVLTNSGAGSLTVRRVSSAPPFLSTTNCGGTLAAGGSCKVTVTYAPIYELVTGSPSGGTRSDAGSLSIESDAFTSPDFVAMTGLVLPVISGSPTSSAVLAAYSLSNSALTFANTQVGNASSAQTVTLTNTGSTTIHVSGVIAPLDFTESSTCGTLLPGDACGLSVSFAPTSASSAALRTGALEIQTDATDSLEYISLIGSSTASPLTFGQSVLNFGSVNVGSTATLSVSVTNNAAAPVTFVGLSAGGAFSVAQGGCPAVGSTLAAGSSCVLTVTFAPTASGSQSGTLSLSSDATQLPLTVALAGTGVAAVPAPASFVLTANGGSAATITVVSGSPATYALLVSPQNGYTGSVALTCVAVNPGRYASCSVLAPLLAMSGSAVGTTVTISTVSAAVRPGSGMFLAMLGLSPMALLCRRKRLQSLLALAMMMLCFGVVACGSGSGVGGTGGSKTVNTPVGTYQYQVTANSTSGTKISSTVTLNLIVQ